MPEIRNYQVLQFPKGARKPRPPDYVTTPDAAKLGIFPHDGILHPPPHFFSVPYDHVPAFLLTSGRLTDAGLNDEDEQSLQASPRGVRITQFLYFVKLLKPSEHLKHHGEPRTVRPSTLKLPRVRVLAEIPAEEREGSDDTFSRRRLRRMETTHADPHPRAHTHSTASGSASLLRTTPSSGSEGAGGPGAKARPVVFSHWIAIRTRVPPRLCRLWSTAREAPPLFLWTSTSGFRAGPGAVRVVIRIGISLRICINAGCDCEYDIFPPAPAVAFASVGVCSAVFLAVVTVVVAVQDTSERRTVVVNTAHAVKVHALVAVIIRAARVPVPGIVNAVAVTANAEGIWVASKQLLPSPLLSHFSLGQNANHLLPLRSPRHLRTPSLPAALALLPLRAKPTLAMSIHIHAPAPISSSSSSQHHVLPPSSQQQRRSQSRSRSRPSSPSYTSAQLPPALPPTSPLARPPMTRPPSRSERLLRDTLRKAEEQERMASLVALTSPNSLFGVVTSPPLAPAFVLSSPKSQQRRHVRRNTSSSSATDASFASIDYFKNGPDVDAFEAEHDDDEEEEEEDDDEVDEQDWLWRTRSATSASSSSSVHLTHQAHPQQQPHFYASARSPGLARKDSTDRSPGYTYARSRAHTDPTGAGASALSPPPPDQVYGSPVSPRAHLQRSAKSAPNVRPPGTHSKRTSADFTLGSGSSETKEPGTMTPHEAVLRTRLEGVLRGAVKEQKRRTRSRERGTSGSGSGTSNSNSMASSRNLSGEGSEFFFGGVE
ncbi:hypothetical protein EIP91_000269, partial [Steccherinum ochraceum]